MIGSDVYSEYELKLFAQVADLNLVPKSTATLVNRVLS